MVGLTCPPRRFPCLLTTSRSCGWPRAAQANRRSADDRAPETWYPVKIDAKGSPQRKCTGMCDRSWNASAISPSSPRKRPAAWRTPENRRQNHETRAGRKPGPVQGREARDRHSSRPSVARRQSSATGGPVPSDRLPDRRRHLEPGHGRHRLAQSQRPGGRAGNESGWRLVLIHEDGGGTAPPQGAFRVRQPEPWLDTPAPPLVARPA